MTAHRVDSRASTLSTAGSRMFTTATSAAGRVSLSASTRAHGDLDAVAPRVVERAVDGNRVVVDREDGAVAEPGGGDPDHAPAAADVQEAARWQAREVLDAEPGGCVSPCGPNARPGLDHACRLT